MKKSLFRFIAVLLCLFTITIFLPQKADALGTLSTGIIASDRFAGNDRYETSANISQAGWKTSYYAILASGENFPDAICAAPLASKYNAPILLTSTDQLNEVTKNELLRLNVKNVIMVGGEGVLTPKVVQALKDLGITVSRIAGIDRYETSLNVAKMLGSFEEAVVATGEDFPEILSISSIAAQKGMPILLTPENSISNSLKDLLSKNVQKTYVLGNAEVISDTVSSQLPSPQRLSGTDRYEANVQIIKKFMQDLDLSMCYIATGTAFPDALSGSALAALTKSAVILVNDPLDNETSNFIQQNSSVLKKVVAFGGTGAVSESLLNSIASASGSNNNVLSAPTNVVAAPMSSSQIYLTWELTSSAATYNIYRSTSYSGTYTNVATVSTPYYSDSYLPAGVTYYYKIQAVNTASTSGYSNIVYATTQSSDGVLSAPQNVVADPSTDKIDLTWDQVSNATSYNIYRTTLDSGVYKIIGTVSTPYYTDSSISAGVMYFYKVQAQNSTGTGQYSSVATATSFLDSNALTAPTNAIAILQSSNQIYVSWNSVSGATYYNVYRATSHNGTYTKVGSVSFPFYTDSSLSSGVPYYYKVQAVNSAGSSMYSNITYTITK